MLSNIYDCFHDEPSVKGPTFIIGRLFWDVNHPLSNSGVLCSLLLSMSLAREDVAALAHLSRIALNEEELARAERELDGVLQYVDRLQKVDKSGVEDAAPDAV